MLSSGSRPCFFADLCQELETACIPAEVSLLGNRINVFSVPHDNVERACRLPESPITAPGLL